MRKILYAVESGGQVYGKQNYSAFAGVGANTSNEKAITIGAGQWYANEARELLKKIKTDYPDDFTKYDTTNIAADLSKSWAGYGVTKTSAKGKAILAIISCESGIKSQDAYMDAQIESYTSNIAKTYGEMTDDAMMECINIIHQGGNSALKRILAKTEKPYSAKTIYAALCTDPDDKTSNNQVGDYVTRQKKVYEFISKYATTTKEDTMTESELRSKVANWLTSYVGVKEGSTKHKEILKIYNNSKLCTRYTVTTSDAWCATAVSAAFIALGLAGKAGSGSVFECVECSCANMITKAKAQGTWVETDSYKPSVGDVILYDWQDSGSGDNTGTPDHVGIVYSVSGNSFKVIEGNISDTVGYRSMTVNGKYIRGFIVPAYSKAATTNSGSGGSTTSNSGTSGTTTSSGAPSKSEKFKGTVTASELNVRKGAGTSYGTCTFSPLKKGAEVSVCDTVKDSSGADWYYIRYNKKYGYVSAKYISKATNASSSGSSGSATQTKTATEAAGSKDASLAGTYKVTAAAGLNLRNGAGVSGNKYGANKTSLVILPKGTTVACYGYYSMVSGTKWLYVQTTYNGVKYIGFAHSAYLQKQ